MHNPLRYQMTEYDCGPTSLLNGISCLLPREDIPPEILRSVMLYCLDCFGPVEEREAVLLFNERTVLTADRTVEYMI